MSFIDHPNRHPPATTSPTMRPILAVPRVGRKSGRCAVVVYRVPLTFPWNSAYQTLPQSTACSILTARPNLRMWPLKTTVTQVRVHQQSTMTSLNEESLTHTFLAFQSSTSSTLIRPQFCSEAPWTPVTCLSLSTSTGDWPMAMERSTVLMARATNWKCTWVTGTPSTGTWERLPWMRTVSLCWRLCSRWVRHWKLETLNNYFVYCNSENKFRAKRNRLLGRRLKLLFLKLLPI